MINYKKVIAYAALVVIVLYVITGFGITKNDTMLKLTFGILTKSAAFEIHNNLLIPLILLLVAHLALAEGWLNRIENNIHEK